MKFNKRMQERYLLKEAERDFDGDARRGDVEILKYRREQNRYEVD